jgi:hypothetical protein
MVQNAFTVYWGIIHIISVSAVVAAAAFLLINKEASAYPFPGALKIINPRKFQHIALGVVPIVAVAHMAFYLALPNYTDYAEPVMTLLGGNIANGGVVYADWNADGAIVGSNYGPYVFLVQNVFLCWAALFLFRSCPAFCVAAWGF